jgi:hypothetical protein
VGIEPAILLFDPSEAVFSLSGGAMLLDYGFFFMNYEWNKHNHKYYFSASRKAINGYMAQAVVRISYLTIIDLKRSSYKDTTTYGQYLDRYDMP